MNYAFGEAYFEYFESCNFSRENTNIDVFVFMFDLRMIDMSSECEYDWYWKISACSTKYSGSTGWYFRYQSIHIQVTYTYQSIWRSSNTLILLIKQWCQFLRFRHTLALASCLSLRRQTYFLDTVIIVKSTQM